MWLVKIDSDTKMVWNDPSNDGWKAISAFLILYQKYGMEGVTVVALSCDYLSMFSNYQQEDRPGRAMEEVYGDRDFLDFENDEVIKNACAKYYELQFNDQMEMYGFNKEMKADLIKKLTEAFKEGDDALIDRLNSRLKKFNETEAAFNKNFDIDEVIEKHSVTSNGYKLTRIEVDIEARKNSKFVSTHKDFKNPDKLGLKAMPKESNDILVEEKPKAKSRKKKK